MADELHRNRLLTPAFDVAILGGGPAGCAAAIALRRLGVPRVLVAEAGRYEEVRIGESIPPDTRLLFRALGIWEAFQEEDHEPCLGSCSSWGSPGLGFNDFLFNPHGSGWHLDRARFDAFLARQAEASGATLWRNALYEAAESGLLRFRDGHWARAPFVIDATGSAARYARQRGASRVLHDRLSCVTGFFAAPFSRHTLLEAAPYGWWYAASLPANRVAVAIATEPLLLKQMSLHTRSAWLEYLAATIHLGPRLVDATLLPGSLCVRTALSCRLREPAGDHWLAIGDAASCFDPLSSQGIYKALASGLEAAQAVVKNDLPAYAASVLRRWEDYIRNRGYFYQSERRWQDAPFWRKRRAPLSQHSGLP